MNETCNVTTALSAFSSISLEEMSTIRLMNRTDTKYIVSLSALMDVLQRASNCYRVQEVQGERNIVYHTTYLDTPDYAMYLAHQNGRVIREKIRVRTYVSSGLTFLEVKNKNNKGRTDKKRIRVQGVNSLRQDGGEEFLRNYAWYELSTLKLLLENHFHHLITGTEARLENLAIIELKRDGRTYSPIGEILRELHVRPSGISKYCVGTVLTAGNLKYNRFKPKLRMAQKIAKKQLMNI